VLTDKVIESGISPEIVGGKLGDLSISIVGQRYLNVRDFEGRETTYEDDL